MRRQLTPIKGKTKMKKIEMEVLSNKQIALDTYEMTLKNKYVCEEAKPGQFLHISIPNFTLRRPISIASVDQANEHVTIIYKIFGTGTDALTTIKVGTMRSEEHTSELQSRFDLVCRLLF